MPKYKKSKDDVARLKLIKANLKDCFFNIKTLKETIKALKVERKQILEKYVTSDPVPSLDNRVALK